MATSKDIANSKKGLNGDSPVFTPSSTNSPLRKPSSLLGAANAAPFTPTGTSVMSASNASSSASPREQLRDLAGGKEAGQPIPRADSSAFNMASVREFVPRIGDQSSGFNAGSAKEFQPKGDRSPFNVAKAVEFRPQSQTVPPTVTPTSSASIPSQTLPSPQPPQPSLISQQSQQSSLSAQQQQQQQQQLLHQQALGQSAHYNLANGQQSQMAIPTGPSRAGTHSNPEQRTGMAGIPNMGGMGGMGGSNNLNALNNMSMAGMGGMNPMAYGMPPGNDAQLGQGGGIFDYNVGAQGGSGGAITTSPYNLYAATSQQPGREGAAFYQGQPPFGAQHQPPGEHLYFPVNPHRQDLLSYQRTIHDFFLPEKLRQEIQSKSRTALQATVTLNIDLSPRYHSISALDTNSHKIAGFFGRITWLYKAVSYKNGNHYCLRRVENFRLSNENALRAASEWKKVVSSNIVTIHEVFTTRAFSDSSILLAMDYFPQSETLMNHHFQTYGHIRPRTSVPIADTVLWGYFVQIANALRAIHSAGLAARCIDLTKIIRTGKNRIRLSGCAVQDVINYDPNVSMADLQQEDFIHFGEVMVSLATYTPPSELKKPLSPHIQLPEAYSRELKAAVSWLLTPAASFAAPSGKTIDALLTSIAPQVSRFFDLSLNENDALYGVTAKEVENGRIARLMMKLGTINERENYSRDASWSEHGPRYPLKLFRDYVFHQVSETGRPVVDAWHIISCLNKLDAGSSEVVRLSSRDGRTNLFVTYKELNKMLQRSFNELIRPGTAPRRQH